MRSKVGVDVRKCSEIGRKTPKKTQSHKLLWFFQGFTSVVISKCLETLETSWWTSPAWSYGRAMTWTTCQTAKTRWRACRSRNIQGFGEGYRFRCSSLICSLLHTERSFEKVVLVDWTERLAVWYWNLLIMRVEFELARSWWRCQTKMNGRIPKLKWAKMSLQAPRVHGMGCGWPISRWFTIPRRMIPLQPYSRRVFREYIFRNAWHLGYRWTEPPGLVGKSWMGLFCAELKWEQLRCCHTSNIGPENG